MRLNKLIWMTALVSAALSGVSTRAMAASNPNTAELRLNCASQACKALGATFAGRLAFRDNNHSWSSFYMMINPAAYAALGPELQGIMRRVSNEAGARQVRLANRANDAGSRTFQ